jgi:RNA polymerase sigma factor (sigma-70 family)
MTLASRAQDRNWPAPFARLADDRLARLVASGHERAFVMLYERYHQSLYRYCRSLVREDADAQDALQSTFAAAFAALRRGQRDAPMRPWLFRIAHNESISILRRRRPSAELSATDIQSKQAVEDQVIDRTELSTLMEDLRELAERQRSALVMRELNGLSHQEIAIALGTSVGAAKQTIFEARRSLFEFAEGRAMACDEIRRLVSDADGRALRGRRLRAHLRDCQACAAFAAAIPARSGELRAIVPSLPAVAAAGLLGRIASVGVGHAGIGHAGGASSLAVGAAAKATAVGTGAGFGANALAGIAVVATATVAVTVGVDKIIAPAHHASVTRSGAPAAAPGNASPAAAPSTSTISVLPVRVTGHNATPSGLVRAAAPGTSPARHGHAPPPGRDLGATHRATRAVGGRTAPGATNSAPVEAGRGAAAGHGNHGVSAPAQHDHGAGAGSGRTAPRGHGGDPAKPQPNHGAAHGTRSGGAPHVAGAAPTAESTAGNGAQTGASQAQAPPGQSAAKVSHGRSQPSGSHGVSAQTN